jgi:hypothetical protein
MTTTVTEYAPAAITNCFNLIKAGIPDAILAGIIGDQAHGYGYHRGRNYCGSGDYSCEIPPDREGDGEAACGLDLSWGSSASQFTVSQRLLNAKNDSRMAPIRSFFGSTDGVNVCGWDYYGGYACTSDDTHLWHVHISILRKYANDTNALAAVAAVITGGGSPGPQPPKPPTGDWFDMATEADLKRVVNQELRAYFASQEGQDRIMVAARTARMRPETRTAAVEDGNQAMRQVLASQEGQDRLMVASRTACLRPEVSAARQQDVKTAITQMEETP